MRRIYEWKYEGIALFQSGTFRTGKVERTALKLRLL